MLGGGGSNEGGTTITEDSNPQALEKLLGTWIKEYSYSTEDYEAIEFSKNGYSRYRGFCFHDTLNSYRDYQFSLTITDESVNAKVTGICFEGTCANVQNKNAVKKLITTIYSNPLAIVGRGCSISGGEYEYYEIDAKSSAEEACERHPEDFGLESADDCKWGDDMINSQVNRVYEEWYEELEEDNYILFSYFYDLEGNALTTYSCNPPVSSKQEVLDIIGENDYGYNEYYYCSRNVYKKQGT